MLAPKSPNCKARGRAPPLALPRLFTSGSIGAVIRPLSIALAIAAYPSLLGAAGLAPEPDRWGCDPLAWDTRDGALKAAVAGSALAPFGPAPVAGRVEFTGDVRIDRILGESWKVAGLSAARDDNNFWALLLVEDPEGKGRHIELGEMRDGKWPSQYDLRRTANEVADTNWKTGERYHLGIALEPGSVVGTIRDASGRQIFRRSYALGDKGTKAGRPALRIIGCEATFASLDASWSEASPTAPAPSFPPYDCSSAVMAIGGKPTGFFHIQQADGRWWIIDPLGRGFVPLGVDHVRYSGAHCETLGYAPYGKKNDAKYPSKADWEAETLERLKSWGFNTLAGGTEPGLLRRGLAHTAMLNVGTAMAALGDDFDITPNERRPCSAFPNVFHPKFNTYCQYRARELCRAHAGDPWLLGYFLDNELAWWGRGDIDSGLFDAVMKKGPAHTAKLALRDFLKARHGGNVEALDRAWGLRLGSFEEILDKDRLSGAGEAATADKKAFAALCADRYFSALARAIRERDPDHMILGCRFAGGRASDVVWASAGKHCDVLSFNYYGSVDLDREIALDHDNRPTSRPLAEVFEGFFRLGGRPMIITEWSFPALDSGLPCTKGAGQRFRTQAERARASEIFARTILAIPPMLGYDYFMWVDEPALGISSAFPENSNYGLVNEDGKPYDLLTSALASVHRDAPRNRLHPEIPPPRTLVPASPPDWRPLVKGESTGACRCDGQICRATVGAVTLQGEIGAPHAARITLDGRPVATLSLGIQRRDGQRDSWPKIARTVGARIAPGTPASVEIVAESRQAPGTFDATCRIVPAPAHDAFVVEWLSIKNTSSNPLDLRAVYFRIDPDEGDPAMPLPLEADRPPRLWKALQKDGWLLPGSAFAGFVAPPGEATVRFWVGQPGSLHPDAKWPVEQTVAPGETLSFPHPPWMICLAGEGGVPTWRHRSDTIGAKIGDRTGKPVSVPLPR